MAIGGLMAAGVTRAKTAPLLLAVLLLTCAVVVIAILGLALPGERHKRMMRTLEELRRFAGVLTSAGL